MPSVPIRKRPALLIAILIIPLMLVSCFCRYTNTTSYDCISEHALAVFGSQEACAQSLLSFCTASGEPSEAAVAYTFDNCARDFVTLFDYCAVSGALAYGNPQACIEAAHATCTAEQSVLESCLMGFTNAQAPTLVPTLTPTPPPVVLQQPMILQAPQANCAVFRLTSPLDGLPNGVAAFYWDPLPQASGYRLIISENNATLAAYDLPGDSYSFAADVSSNAVGGGFSLTITLQAYINNQVACSQTVTLAREALAPPLQPPFCGNHICEAGEGPRSCCIDCGRCP